MVIFNARGNLGICADLEVGTWFIRVGRWAAFIKASWNKPLFSERNDYNFARVPLGFGWRFVLRRDKCAPQP